MKSNEPDGPFTHLQPCGCDECAKIEAFLTAKKQVDDGGPAYPQAVINFPSNSSPGTTGFSIGGPQVGIQDPTNAHIYTHAMSTGGFGGNVSPWANGMSLRDAFAIAALPVLIKDAMEHNGRQLERNFVRDDRDVAAAYMPVEFDEIAAKSYVAADAMLRARK